MPDTTSLKEFVQSVRTRKRYHSQCTPEKTIIIPGILKKKIFFFLFLHTFLIGVVQYMN